MQDYLAIINRVIEEHQKIGVHLKLVGDSLSDAEALFNLERLRAEWVPGQPGGLTEKGERLMQALSVLEEGLGNHFHYEEKYLPQILGEFLMRALILDHQDIRKKLGEVKTMVNSFEPARINRDELLLRESDIQQLIGSLGQAVERHRSREEVVLDMLRRVLEEK